MSDAQPVNARRDGRLPDGRFGLGNRASLGNANNRRMSELRRSLLESATPEKIVAVGARLCELAEAGDVQAAKLYLEYTVGKPAQAIELSGFEGEPLGVTIHQLKTVILAAVADDPSAQVKVAHALRALTQSIPNDDEGGDDQPG